MDTSRRSAAAQTVRNAASIETDQEATGGRDPRLVNAYAGLLAASHTDAALAKGIRICEDALAGRDGDGNPIQLRRHSAENPKRRREPRFRLAQ